MNSTAVRASRETVRVRRAPKYSVFIALGVAAGILLAMVLTFSFNGTDEKSPFTGMEYSSGQVFGFLLLICIPVVVAIAILIALIFDRVFARRERGVRVLHETVLQGDASEPDDRGDDREPQR